MQSSKDPSDFLRHRGSMLLLDEISYNENEFFATVKHQRGSVFANSDGSVPNWVAIEYMAQTVCAYTGYLNLKKQGKLRYGLLLSVSKFKSNISFFNKNQEILIFIKEILKLGSDIAVFESTITNGLRVETIATAQITGAEVDTEKELEKLS